MTIQELLEAVRDGNVTVKEAETLLKKESYEELGYAKLDTGRKNRTGFAEVVYCSGKADQHLLNIYEDVYKRQLLDSPAAFQCWRFGSKI